MEPKKIDPLDVESGGQRGKLKKRRSPRDQGYIENQIADTAKPSEGAGNSIKAHNLQKLKDLYKESSQVSATSKVPKTTKHASSKVA